MYELQFCSSRFTRNYDLVFWVDSFCKIMINQAMNIHDQSN